MPNAGICIILERTFIDIPLTLKSFPICGFELKLCSCLCTIVLNLKRVNYSLSVCGLSSRIRTSGKKLEFFNNKKNHMFFGNRTLKGSKGKFLKAFFTLDVKAQR